MSKARSFSFWIWLATLLPPAAANFSGHAHHPCLGFSSGQAYSAPGGPLAMSAHAIAESLKQRIPLLDNLVSQAW